MKKFIPLLVLALVIVTLTGCPLLGQVSVEDRMDMFVATINAKSWSMVKQHTSSTAAAHNTADASFWEGEFEPFDPLTVTSTGSSSATCSGVGGVTFTFSLDDFDSEGDYKINYIAKDGVGIFD